MKIEISKRKKTENFMNTWKLNNTPKGSRKKLREIKNIFKQK
jgi:hypothetical protein